MTSQALNRPVDVIGVLDAAGANPYAEEGSPAWELARLGAAVAELFQAHRELLTGIGLNDIPESGLKKHGGSLGERVIRSRAALASIEVTP